MNNNNQRNVNGSTPLHYAVITGENSLVRSLIEHGTDLNAKEHSVVGGYTPLIYAVKNDNIQAADMLLSCGADPNLPGDFMKLAPLHFAAKLGRTSIVRLLISKGVDIHKRDANGWSASFWAREKGHESIVGILPSPTCATMKDQVLAMAVRRATAPVPAPPGRTKKTGGERGKAGGAKGTRKTYK